MANSGSSLKTGAMSLAPGMSAAVSTATTPGAARTGVEIERDQLARRLGRAADGDVQRALRLANVVDIGREAAHMQPRGIVRMRLVDDLRLALQRHARDDGHLTQRHASLPAASGPRRPAISVSARLTRLAATVER